MNSAYFPHEEGGSLPSPGLVVKLMEYCQELPLIMGCDANVHHKVWSNININDRGRRLLEYLVNVLRREVLGLTLCSRNLIPKIVGWEISSEPSLSDHRQIVFKFVNVRLEAIYRRNLRRTDLDSFRKNLSTDLCGFPERHRTGAEVDLCVDYLQRALMSFKKNCPTRAVHSNKRISW
ncbi:hypothetical protein ACFW04_014049 [Cataglyphis niger]